MVKKLQALKAKKGFTLVELVVVIAIIGVLAAILVPTMMGMVTKARVTSVDSTASKLKDTIGQWMIALDTAGGKVPSNAAVLITGANATGGATKDKLADTGWAIQAWSLKTDLTADKVETSLFVKNGDKDNAGALLELAQTLCANYDFNKIITAVVYVEGRKSVACVYTDSAYDGKGVVGTPNIADATAMATKFTLTGIRGGKCGWNGSDAGIMDSGVIIGSSPKIELDKNLDKDSFEKKS